MTEAAPGLGRSGSLHATAVREQSLERLTTQDHDVLVVGGGINGAVSALALASHGLRVALIDSEDFASGVSQESSNLIWGGFKYLQTYDVALVAGLCRSRNLLARSYASRVREVRFLAALGSTSPYSPAYAALGAHAYWALGRFATGRPRRLSSRSLATAEPAIDSDDVQGAVEYSDYLLADNDARFVLQLLLDAIDSGAVAVSRMRLDGAERAGDGWRAGGGRRSGGGRRVDVTGRRAGGGRRSGGGRRADVTGRRAGGGWRVDVTDRLTGDRHTVEAAVLVNAAGPRATELAALTGTALRQALCYSKGAHIVVPQVTESGRVLALFDDDQRLFYVIPMGHRSLIGTTDTRVEDAAAPITHHDRDFLLEQANARLRLPRPLGGDDVIAYRCGVRALVVDDGEDTDRDWTELSRRHAVEADEQRATVSILGGKLSDCLNVGQEVVAAARRCGLAPEVPDRAWYGEPPAGVRDRFRRSAVRAGIDEPAAARLWRRHGRRALEVADLVEEAPELGEPLSDLVECSAAEVVVMARHEHVLSMDDFLRRRTMLAMLETAETLSRDPGVERAESLLFGPEAERTGSAS